MKKIILTFIAMLLAGVNTAWADDVAQIGETKYQSLSTAFAEANGNSGSTLYLLKDVTLDDGETLQVTGNFTLDLNGKKITANSQTTSSTNDDSRNGCAILLMRGATLTIDDASGNNSGTISNTNASGQAAIRVLDSRHQPSDYNATTVKTTLVINGGTFTCGDNGKNAIAGYGRCHNTDIIINGGVITGGIGCGIYHPQIGTLTINGGSISGASAAVVMHAGTLTIADGTFEATSTWNGNASTPIPAAIRIDQYDDTEHSGLQKPIEVNINGGTFIATQDDASDVPTDKNSDSKALTVANSPGNETSMGSVVVNISDGDFQGGILKTDTRTTTKINISGGTYRYIVDEANCAENCSPVTTPNNDSKYTVINNVPAVIDGEVQIVSDNITTPYETLAGAFADVQDGETIELLKNVTLSSDIVCPLTSGTIYFKFGRFKVNKGNSSIKLKIAAANGARAAVPAATVGGPVVYTDNQTDIFTAAGSGTTLLVSYNPANAAYPYSYQTVPGDQSIDEALARNEQTGMLFSDLQLAIDLASAGQTIELLPGIENVTLDKTVVINKNLTIEGNDHQVTSEVKTGSLYGPRLDPAFHITGPGSVTLNKVNIVAPYVVPGHGGPGMYDQYTSGSVGIVVDHQFNDSLVINYSTITTTGRGIDILSIGGGFVLDVKHSTITTTDDDPSTPYGAEAAEFDPTKVYINSFEGDPYGRGRGINFGNNATTCVANIQFSKIQGYAYPINVGEFNVNTGKIVLNMTDCSTWGRDVINNSGDQSTFNLDNITAHGYNNELSANNESFAAIVDYKNADLNFYNIKDLKVISNVKASDAAGTSASENFIDLRGTNATVKIVGNSAYEVADSLKDRVGFLNTNLTPADDLPEGDVLTNGEEVYEYVYRRLIDKSINNRIYFDDQAKAYFNYWFEIIPSFDYDYDNDNEDEEIRIAIADEKDHTNLYPVVPLEVKVMMTITEESDDPNNPIINKYYFGNLNDAFNSEHFDATAEIQLLANVDLDEDITVKLDRGYDFSLTLINPDGILCTVNVSNDASIKLPPLVYAYCDEAQGGTLFSSADTTLTVIKGVSGGVITYYVPANVYYADTYEAPTGDPTVVDPNDPNYYNENIDGGLLWIFKELLTADDQAPLAITADCYVRLEADVKLDETYILPIGGDLDNEEVFYLDLNNHKIKGYYKSLAMQLGTAVYTTGTIDIFSSLDPAYTVVYDILDTPIETTYTDFEGNPKTVRFTHKYYLLKDGLTITVDPATFCGDRLTPNFVVKKKFTEVDPTNPTQTVEVWKVLTGVTKDDYDNNTTAAQTADFYWYLVPPASDDDDSTYVSAKTYVQALVIEGISFQGTRKADFTILPRDIKDAVVKDSTNILKWRAEGYTPAQIADTLLLVYNCLTHNSDTLLTKYNATTKKGDYLISVADGPEAGGKYLEVDTYSQVITVTAVEGGNYTGTLKLDFTIIQDGLIDISQCMVVSDATYTSDTLPPLKRRLKVILKDPATGTETVVDSAAYTLEVHGAPESYINAQTYSNAITIKGRSSYIPSDGSSTTPVKGYYGSLDADYVIKPRDLADSLDVIAEKDNQGKVTLEAYAGANKPATTPATIYLKWTGSELLPVINGAVTDPVSNNINLILTAQKDTLPGQSTSAKVVYPLIASDYTYTIEPAPMVDPGIYKIIFTGRGNFTGMREVNVMVLKDINSPSIASEVPLQIIPNNDNLKPSELKDIVVKDGEQTLVLGTHYSVTVIGQDKTEYTETNPIITDSIYSVIFKGIEPYYYEADTTEMIVLYEFYSYDTANNGGAYYNSQPNGYEPADTAMSIRVLSGKELNCLVGDYPKSRKSAIDSTLLTFTIPETATIKIDMGTTTGIYAFNLKVVGIEDSSFYSCDTLHWVDATAIKGYTPSTLSRSDVGPFAGYPVQSLVYLDGSSVSGTNYVYEVSPGTFECEELKIYDDQQGKQKGFTEGGGPKWDFRNKYEFTADKVTNTRYFLAGQHYTTCLPYKLKVNSDLKVYTLDAASDQIFGFKELSLDSLAHFTPFLLIPSKAGNLLNNEGRTVVYVTPTADQGILNPKTTPTNQATMYGSTIYMDKNTTAPTTTTAIYIMQSENKWKKIPADKEYDDACVLPMRAYIQVPVTSPAREYIMGKIIDSVEHPTVEVADDWSNAEVYDLQGRKVDTTARLPKGVYIVNGQKRIRK